MADYSVTDMKTALSKKQRPTVTLWNRVEGRPRTVNFERALRVEVRDALWMLTRQWQTGELQGEDAGSPVQSQMHVLTTRLTRFRPGAGAALDFDDSIPLETQVEQQPLNFMVGQNKVALDLRLVMGHRWLKLIAGIADYAGLFIAKYKIDMPDPARREQAAIGAHPEVCQTFTAAAERAMDGVALYQYLKGDATRQPYDGVAVLDAHKPALTLAGQKFIAWVDRMFSQPNAGENPAWQPSHLEYRFACAAPGVDGEKVYAADEYFQGSPDWHTFDIDPSGAAWAASGATPDPRGSITRTMIPVPIKYAGMPHPRWWTIEDTVTNFGEIRPDTTDLAKLLFMEFGLVYSNDWFVVPFTLPGGSIASVKGLAVTNVFGERIWIDAAGSGPDDAWQRWSMFTVNTKGTGGAADTSLLLLPTVPKVQEGAPLEQVALIRDEVANMVWGIEKIITAPDGQSKRGANAGQETRAYFERLVAAGGNAQPPALLENNAKIRYETMTTVPEHWIPLIGVRARGSQRQIDLQRASLLRIIQGDTLPPQPVTPRTALLRVGMDQTNPQPYLIAEEEVPRAGLLVTRTFQRTRWLDGKVFVWLGVRKRVGRGEGSSGLAFDQITPKEPN